MNVCNLGGPKTKDEMPLMEQQTRAAPSWTRVAETSRRTLGGGGQLGTQEQVLRAAFANAGPEACEAGASPIWATFSQPRGKQDGIDGPGTRPAHSIELEIALSSSLRGF